MKKRRMNERPSNHEGKTRRSVLTDSITGLGGAWLASRWPGILEAQEHAQRAAKAAQPGKLEFFTPADAREIDAITAQIIPTDGTPGAREAGALHFIDRTLMTFESDKQPVYTDGLKMLHAKSIELFPASAKFSDLTAAQQIELMKAIEKSPFFALVRLHTLIGFFANPEYGGNQQKVGWQLIGFSDAFNFKPPFGDYDRDYKQGS